MKTALVDESLDVEEIRKDFPIFKRKIHGEHPLIYLDSAATSQKPQTVYQAMSHYYEVQNANIHRGIHQLAEEATSAYEAARKKTADFISATSERQIIFTRNTTESINLIAQSWGRTHLNSGDLIVLTEMEHHSNLVPWQMLAQERDLRLEFISLTDDLSLDRESYRRLLQEEPKLVGFTHMSNVTGVINPAAELTRMAKEAGATTVIDAAQSVPHLGVDVEQIDPDFLAFSGHKMCGPTGIGVLYGRRELLEDMPPFLGGGDMIKRVKLREFSTNELPQKFEAGTPAIAEAIGLGEAVDYLSALGMDAIHIHEQRLIAYALERLEEVPGIEVYGPDASKKGGVASFSFEGIHPHDVAQVLDRLGIAVRAGHHCAMPLHDKLELPATTRASFYLYNTTKEVDRLIEGLYQVKQIFG
jgi:cysteine desulfurase/selenocysteine lyase